MPGVGAPGAAFTVLGHRKFGKPGPLSAPQSPDAASRPALRTGSRYKSSPVPTVPHTSDSRLPRTQGRPHVPWYRAVRVSTWRARQGQASQHRHEPPPRAAGPEHTARRSSPSICQLSSVKPVSPQHPHLTSTGPQRQARGPQEEPSFAQFGIHKKCQGTTSLRLN